MRFVIWISAPEEINALLLNVVLSLAPINFHSHLSQSQVPLVVESRWVAHYLALAVGQARHNLFVPDIHVPEPEVLQIDFQALLQNFASVGHAPECPQLVVDNAPAVVHPVQEQSTVKHLPLHSALCRVVQHYVIGQVALTRTHFLAFLAAEDH